MAIYNDMLSSLPRIELAEATEFVTVHGEHGVSRVTSGPEPACPYDSNNGDLMRTLINFVCVCGKRLDLEIIA